MGSRSGQTARLAAVEDATPRRTPPGEVIDPARRYDPLLEERWLRDQFRRERSSAYWFAASKWGALGLLAGLFIGAFMMYAASVSTMPVLRDAMASAAAIQAAQSAAEGEARRSPQGQ